MAEPAAPGAAEQTLFVAPFLPPAAAAGEVQARQSVLGAKSQNLYQSLFDHLPVIDIIKRINLLETAKTLMWQRI